MIFVSKLFLGLVSVAGVIWMVRSEISLQSSASNDKKTEWATDRTRRRREENDSLIMTQAERIEFLAIHNRIRNDLGDEEQPSAANMKRMYWSAQLEASAVSWSVRCCSGSTHGQSEVVNLQEFQTATLQYGSSIGQNIYVSPGGKTSVSDILTLFANESRYFTYSLKSGGSCRAGKKCEQYTQLVWATSFRVGCGYAFCGDHYTATCNYLPGGNLRGNPIYNYGDPCSQCASDEKYNFTECEGQLCVPKDRCSPVKECEVVDTENCLCSEESYKEIVGRMIQNTGAIHVRLPFVVCGLLFPLVASLLGQGLQSVSSQDYQGHF